MRTARRIVTVLATALICTAVALAQSPTATGAVTIPISNKVSANSIWPEAGSGGAYKGKVFVVTFDRPDHRQACHIQSITEDRLTCSRGIGAPRTYLREKIVALIIAGDAGSKLPIVLGFNVGLGAAIWGTVVLAATCPPCAVATSIVAFAFFGGAGAVLIGDDQPTASCTLPPANNCRGSSASLNARGTCLLCESSE